MADLNRRDRGQILLVAAFALAAIFIGLAIVANSAIYTENLATRGGSIDASDALKDRHAIQQTVGDVVESANWNETSATYSAKEDHVRGGVDDDLAAWALNQRAREGALVDIAYIGSNSGSMISQNNGSEFRSSDRGVSSEADWTLADDVDSTRAFRMNITEVNADDFVLNVTDPGVNANWTMNVRENYPDYIVEVQRENPDRTASCRVERSGDPVVIDVTGATLGGKACPALDIVGGDRMSFGAGVSSPYQIQFENGNSIEGDYSLIVDTGGIDPSILDQNYGNTGATSASQPYIHDAVYESSVRLEYHTETIEYLTDVRAAPGEPDD